MDIISARLLLRGNVDNSKEGSLSCVVKSFPNVYEPLVNTKHISAALTANCAVKDAWTGSAKDKKNNAQRLPPYSMSLKLKSLHSAGQTLHADPTFLEKGFPNNNLCEFLQRIKQQRSQFENDLVLLESFDREWGINSSDGNFQICSRCSISGNCFHSSEKRVDKLIQEEYDSVSTCSKRKIAQLSSLRDSVAFTYWCGIHILHLFFIDLIGRHSIAAIVFAEKCQQEYVFRYITDLCLLRDNHVLFMFVLLSQFRYTAEGESTSKGHCMGMHCNCWCHMCHSFGDIQHR